MRPTKPFPPLIAEIRKRKFGKQSYLQLSQYHADRWLIYGYNKTLTNIL
jgi:hypothetical protein